MAKKKQKEKKKQTLSVVLMKLEAKEELEETIPKFQEKNWISILNHLAFKNTLVGGLF